MADPDKPTWEQLAADGQRKLRELEEVMRGMSSRDFGNHRGKFIEPVRIREPVLPMNPEDQDILEAVASIFDVSANPLIATPIGDLSSGRPSFDPNSAAQESYSDIPSSDVDQPVQTLAMEMAQDEPVRPPEMPDGTDPAIEQLGGTFPQIDPVSQPAGMAPPSLDIPRSQVNVPTEELFPEARASAKSSPWPPGLGREAANESERKAVIAEARAEAKKRMQEQARGQLGQPAAGQATPSMADQFSTPDQRPESKAKDSGDKTQESASSPTASARAYSSSGAGDSDPPPQERMGVGATSSGFVPEFGDSGQSFYQTPTASQVSILQQAHEAVDSTTNYTEIMLEVLRRLTASMTRATEGLIEIVDRLDSEEDSDEF